VKSAATSHYSFDNAAPQAGDRFAHLSALYDDVTSRHLDRLGIRAGWSGLEVGAGGGSIALFMSRRVGVRGHVVATDINTDWMSCPLPANVELRCHDIGIDPLPDATFDVIHARAVLTFVPERRTALQRMIAALKPSGWLLIEELLPPITEAWDRPDEPDVALARKARLAIFAVAAIRCSRKSCPSTWEPPAWPTSARRATSSRTAPTPCSDWRGRTSSSSPVRSSVRV